MFVEVCLNCYNSDPQFERFSVLVAVSVPKILESVVFLKYRKVVGVVYILLFTA